MSQFKPQSTPDPLASQPPAPSTRANQLLHLVFWTSSAGRHLRRCLGILACTVGLTDGELLTIWLCLSDGKGMVQGELAAAVGISPAQMSGIVERLRQRGLIEMHRQTLDRRRQVWRGTPAGELLLEALSARLAKLATGIDARLEPADQHAALALCQRLVAAVEALPEEIASSTTDNSTHRTELRSSNEAA